MSEKEIKRSRKCFVKFLENTGFRNTREKIKSVYEKDSMKVVLNYLDFSNVYSMRIDDRDRKIHKQYGFDYRLESDDNFVIPTSEAYN